MTRRLNAEALSSALFRILLQVDMGTCRAEDLTWHECQDPPDPTSVSITYFNCWNYPTLVYIFGNQFFDGLPAWRIGCLYKGKKKDSGSSRKQIVELMDQVARWLGSQFRTCCCSQVIHFKSSTLYTEQPRKTFKKRPKEALEAS